jgi:hypothetical protein
MVCSFYGAAHWKVSPLRAFVAAVATQFPVSRQLGSSVKSFSFRASTLRSQCLEQVDPSGKTNRFDGVGFGLKCEKPFDSSLEIGSRRGLPWGVRPA